MNLCRHFNGFQGAKAVDNGPGMTPSLFAKFVDTKSALECAECLAQTPFDEDLPQTLLKVAFARSELDLSHGITSGPGRSDELIGGTLGTGPVSNNAGFVPPSMPSIVPVPVPVPLPVVSAGVGNDQIGFSQPPSSTGFKSPGPPPVGHSESGKVFAHMATQQGGTITTIMIPGATEKNLTEQALKDHFAKLPGFSALKLVPRVGHAFVRFTSRDFAQAALTAANTMGMRPCWATRNLMS